MSVDYSLEQRQRNEILNLRTEKERQAKTINGLFKELDDSRRNHLLGIIAKR